VFCDAALNIQVEADLAAVDGLCRLLPQCTSSNDVEGSCQCFLILCITSHCCIGRALGSMSGMGWAGECGRRCSGRPGYPLELPWLAVIRAAWLHCPWLQRVRGSNFLASNGRKPVDRNVDRQLKHRALLRCLQQCLLLIVEWQLLGVKGLLRQTPLWQASCNVLLAL
jgi:hypothetical protein